MFHSVNSVLLSSDEILVFYLSRFLELDNVPPVVLAKVDSSTAQWKKVASNFTKAKWKDGHMVALIKWIPQCKRSESAVHAITVFNL